MRRPAVDALSSVQPRAAAALTLLALAAAGCATGGAKPSVQVALTAPTDGAVVTESAIRVFGTVTPASAAVTVAGRRVHVANGAFARWMSVPRGVSRIKIRATAAGYAPALLSVAVRSSPVVRRGHPGSGAAPAGSVASAAAPGSSQHYDSRVRATFLRTCEAAAGAGSGAAATCECALSYVEARVSERALGETERAIVNGEATVPAVFREAALACRR